MLLIEPERVTKKNQKLKKPKNYLKTDRNVQIDRQYKYMNNNYVFKIFNLIIISLVDSLTNNYEILK